MTADDFKPASKMRRRLLFGVQRLTEYGVELYEPETRNELRVGLIGDMPEHCRWLYHGILGQGAVWRWRHHRRHSCLLSGYNASARRREFRTEQVASMLQVDAQLAKDSAKFLGLELNMAAMVAALRLVPGTEAERVLAVHDQLGLEGLHLLTHHPQQWVQANPEFTDMPHDLVLRMYGLGEAYPYYLKEQQA